VRPKRTRASSVRPAPTRPANPRISPARTEKFHAEDTRSAAAEVFHLEHRRAERDLALRENGGNLAAHHQADELALVDILHRPRRDRLPVAEDGRAIGHLVELVQPVRDVDDPDFLGAEIADDLEEAVHLLPGKRGGGLVHDEDLRVGAERAGDLDELLLGIESALTGRSGEIFAPIRSSRSPARLRRSAHRMRRHAPPRSYPIAMFSAMVRSGKSAGC